MDEFDRNFDPDEFPYQIRSTSTYTPPTEEERRLKQELLSELSDVLTEWNSRHESLNYDPLPAIIQIAEIIEKGTEEFFKRDPDPLDDRHPHRTHPESAFGNLLKYLFRNDDFMNKLVISYILGRDNVELSTQSCRVLLGCVPGLDSNVVFSEPDDFVPRLYVWARDSSNETLQAYSMGLLAAVLEVQDNVTKYRNENLTLVPIALRRLKELKGKMEDERKANTNTYPYTSFAHLVQDDESSNSNEPSTSTPKPVKETSQRNSEEPPKKRRKTGKVSKIPSRIPSLSGLSNLENSNSKWDSCQPYLIGTHKVYPLSLEMYQRLILQYLCPTGEYQDLLSMTYEGNAMNLILFYIDLEKSLDVRLTFDALKYLTCLLVHRKFALEFVALGGVQILLKTKRESLASVGVVTTLYYIAYNNDVMEAVCQLNEKLIDNLVDFCLWCLEHCHENGRSSAAMFFTHALYYKKILERFDQMDGPRKLYNYIATLTMLQEVAAKIHYDLSEEQVYTSTQCVRNATNTFRTYVASHLYLKLESIRKSINAKVGSLNFPAALLADIAPDKTMKGLEEYTWECQKVLCDIMRISNVPWKPISELKRLGVIQKMISVHVLSGDFSSMSRSDISQGALEVISICCVLPKVQLELIESHTHVDKTIDGITALLRASKGVDPEETPSVRISALKTLILCLTVDKDIYKKLDQTRNRSSEEKKESNGGRKGCSSRNSPSPARVHLETMWAATRKKDGIMTLTEVVHTRVPTTDADNIRTRACTALGGLARCEEVRQLLSKMPLVANNELQGLMREPVAEDKKVEHQLFCREATSLLEIVSGKTMHDQAKDLTQEKIHKQWIVENTKINFNEKELLQLMIQYLSQSGYQESAAVLKREADLPDFPVRGAVSSTPAKSNSNETSVEGTSSKRQNGPRSMVLTSPVARSSSAENDEIFATPTSVARSKNSINRSILNFPKKYLNSPMKPVKTSPWISNESHSKPYRTLDGIVSEYLRTQHARCKNPVTTCPPFSLYFPHRCPEISTAGVVSTNIAKRQLMRDILVPNKRIVSNWQDERYMFSRFKMTKTIHEHDETYTSSAFAIDDEHLIVGLFSGEVHWVNIETSSDESTTNCHNSAVTNIEPSSDGTMLLTSSAYVRPLSALWKLGEAMEILHVFNEDSSVKFSNTSLDRIVGTYISKATLYDSETKHALSSFQSTEFDGTRYSKNAASFSPCDRLIFNDGILWDVRTSGQPLHIFDKLKENSMNGVFHPHGNQVIINSEVFDIRNYRLLHYVPALDQCKVVFNSTGNMMYASMLHDYETDDFNEPVGSSSFRTFDTSDYSVITTVDIKKPILGLTSSHNDTLIGIIEQLRPHQNDFMMSSATQVRIYAAGRQRNAGDDFDDVDDDEEENDDDDDENDRSDGSDGSDSEESLRFRSDDENDDDDMHSDRMSEPMSVFEALGRLGDMEGSDDNRDDEDRHRRRNFRGYSEESVFGESDRSTFESNSSSGWETDSREGDDRNDRSGSSDDEEDNSYEPDPENDIDSRSSTALNPHLRRQNQNNQ